MKTLYMVRHAKSSWKHDVIDHERPLKSRGKRDAKLVSEEVSKQISIPERLISSDANRALSTSKYFKDALKIEDKNFATDHGLYDFSGEMVLNIIKKLDESLKSVMIFGHNHAFTSIANMLGNDYIDNLPTCGFVMIEFDVDNWADVALGRTVKKIFPRDLK